MFGTLVMSAMSVFFMPRWKSIAEWPVFAEIVGLHDPMRSRHNHRVDVVDEVHGEIRLASTRQSGHYRCERVLEW